MAIRTLLKWRQNALKIGGAIGRENAAKIGEKKRGQFGHKNCHKIAVWTPQRHYVLWIFVMYLNMYLYKGALRPI